MIFQFQFSRFLSRWQKFYKYPADLVPNLMHFHLSKVYLCTCTHTWIMVTKTISITEGAYEALLREKKNKESFTEIILRITKKSGKLGDSFGAWKMTDEEEEAIQAELSEGWRMTRERLYNEMPRH